MFDQSGARLQSGSGVHDSGVQSIPEQEEAKRLLGAALAYAAELLGDEGRVERRSHPDLYLLEPLGDQIRIGAIRELRHDLHMRPFEADRRVYVIFGAHAMNEEAADALLKDLEEPHLRRSEEHTSELQSRE